MRIIYLQYALWQTKVANKTVYVAVKDGHVSSSAWFGGVDFVYETDVGATFVADTAATSTTRVAVVDENEAIAQIIGFIGAKA